MTFIYSKKTQNLLREKAFKVWPNKNVTRRLHLFVVQFLFRGLRVFVEDVQHGVVQREEEHGWLNFIIEEATVVQFLQDVSCRWGEENLLWKSIFVIVYRIFTPENAYGWYILAQTNVNFESFEKTGGTTWTK